MQSALGTIAAVVSGGRRDCFIANVGGSAAETGKESALDWRVTENLL